MMKPLGLLLLLGGLFVILTAIAFFIEVDNTVAALGTVLYAGLMLFGEALLGFIVIFLIFDSLTLLISAVIRR